MEKVPEVPKLRSISFASSSTHALHYSYIVLALNFPPYCISPKKEKRKKKEGSSDLGWGLPDSRDTTCGLLNGIHVESSSGVFSCAKFSLHAMWHKFYE